MATRCKFAWFEFGDTARFKKGWPVFLANQKIFKWPPPKKVRKGERVTQKEEEDARKEGKVKEKV